MAADDSPDNSAQPEAGGRAQSFRVAAQAMRRILVGPPRFGGLDLHAAPCELATSDARNYPGRRFASFRRALARPHRRRAADSVATVEREWQVAQAAAYSRLKGPRDDA